MDSQTAIEAFSALSQSTRLDVFRALIAVEPQGIAAGDLARQGGVPQNTMSTHLAVLMRAGLVSRERRGRSILYRASLASAHELALFLLKNCCNGSPEICALLDTTLTPCSTSGPTVPTGAIA